MDEPPVTFYMMAGARKGQASPLNRQMTSANWPPAYREVRYFLSPDLKLATTAPTAPVAKVSYKFDPANPVTTFGGANLTFLDGHAQFFRRDYLMNSTSGREEKFLSDVIWNPNRDRY
jgi:prepilin-type processing-associated H-X9-DG protein